MLSSSNELETGILRAGKENHLYWLHCSMRTGFVVPGAVVVAVTISAVAKVKQRRFWQELFFAPEQLIPVRLQAWPNCQNNTGSCVREWKMCYESFWCWIHAPLSSRGAKRSARTHHSCYIYITLAPASCTTNTEKLCVWADLFPWIVWTSGCLCLWWIEVLMKCSFISAFPVLKVAFPYE